MAKSLILQGFLASMTGFEPATPCSGGTYSIQLSYMDIFSFFDALMPT